MPTPLNYIWLFAVLLCNHCDQWPPDILLQGILSASVLPLCLTSWLLSTQHHTAQLSYQPLNTFNQRKIGQALHIVTKLMGVMEHGVFSCDEQLKKWRCHSVRSFVRVSVRLPPFFLLVSLKFLLILKSFNGVSRQYKECLKFNGSFKGVSRKF